MIKRTVLFILLICSGIQSHLQGMHSQSNHINPNQELLETGAKFVLFSAVIASCTYALYKIGSWIFTETDEQVFQAAFTRYTQCHKKYKQLITIWSQEIAYPTDEQLLAALNLDNNSIDFVYNLGKNLNALEEHKKKLHKRLLEFKDGKNFTDALESRMEKLSEKIKRLHKSLQPIHSYLAKHNEYFNLVHKIHTLQKNYLQEITALEKHRNDEQTMHKILTSHIMSSAKNNRYPYIQYIEALSNAINALKKALHDCKHSYQSAEQTAHQLKEYLECIHSLILIHNAYHHELQARERNRLKEKKIALEKAKVRAQQDQARALEEQNWLRREEIYNQEKILRKLDKKTA